MDFEYNTEKLEKLFYEAKEKDEFEFCSTLLRIRGMAGPGWDSLEESYTLITEMLSMINSPITSSYKIRMLLLLYAHITEMNDFYNIIANLLWVKHGDRYRLNPFHYELFDDRRTVNYPEGKALRIGDIAERTGDLYFKELYSFMLCKQIRNAFYHSDYTLFDNEFRIISGEGVCIDDVVRSSIPFEWLIPKIEVTTNLIIQVFSLINEHRFNYIENKVVEARLGPEDSLINVELIGGEFGLTGFKSGHL